MGRHGENIRKRKDGRWEGRYKVFHENKGKHIYRSVYGYTYEDVKVKLSRARLGFTYMPVGKNQIPKETASEKNNHRSCTTILFSQAAREWLEEICEKRKYSTYIKYEAVYKTHLAKIIGLCQLSDTVTVELQTKISEYFLEKTHSESLQKSICCIVNQILAFANKKYFINASPLRNLSVKSKKRLPITFSKAEQARLLSGIYDELNSFKIALLLCLYTGLRLGELCALKWADFDFDGMTVTVNRTVQRVTMQGHLTKTILQETDPKSESSRRTIPLTSETMKLLTQIKKDQLYVFGGEKPLDPRTMQYRFKSILKEANVDYRNFHILRHTFATNCVENGMDVKTLSEILGHSDVKITLNRYVHPTMESKREQMKRLPDFYGQICGQAV